MTSENSLFRIFKIIVIAILCFVGLLVTILTFVSQPDGPRKYVVLGIIVFFSIPLLYILRKKYRSSAPIKPITLPTDTSERQILSAVYMAWFATILCLISIFLYGISMGASFFNSNTIYALLGITGVFFGFGWSLKKKNRYAAAALVSLIALYEVYSLAVQKKVTLSDVVGWCFLYVFIRGVLALFRLQKSNQNLSSEESSS